MKAGISIAILALLLAMQAALPRPCFPSEQLQSQQVKKIISGVVKAYGGDAALGKVRTVVVRGTIRGFVKGDQGSYQRYYERPRKLRVETVYDRSAETRVLNGERGWRGSNGAPLTEVKGPPFLAMAYQYKYLDLPLGLLDHPYRISYGGKETLGGTEVDVLLLSDPEGPPMRVYIDSRTRIIRRVAGEFVMGEMGGAELAVEFSDYRPVDGVLFPFKMVNYAGGTTIAETVVSEVGVNPKLDEELFKPDGRRPAAPSHPQ